MNSLRHIDREAIARLQNARRLAVESLSRPRPAWRRHSWALPAGATAAILIAVATGMFWWKLNSQPVLPFTTANNEDMSIVLGNDNLDMYADLDFYNWLQLQEQQKSQPSNPGDDKSG
ncbi:MAG: hypothetical protein KGL13_01880 [Gammaproteobacteria bacterium]|nr:hypothetical protein [Gammaproteobacteria bacterium]MDE2345195.1 hypothetical protein [Gammaproteobacteria bacterium]